MGPQFSSKQEKSTTKTFEQSLWSVQHEPFPEPRREYQQSQHRCHEAKTPGAEIQTIAAGTRL